MSSTLTDLRRASQDTNFHMLDCGEVILGGVRFLGCTLWTDFALRIDTPEGAGSDQERSAREAGLVIADFRTIRVSENDEAGNSNGQRISAQRPFTPQDSMDLHHAHRTWLWAKLQEPFDGPTVV